MRLHYIIDGYNFIHRVPKFRKELENNLEQARNALISDISAYLSQRKMKITLVFDGDEIGNIDSANRSSKRLAVIFSNFPEKADPLIKRILRSVKNKKSVTLVSADRELIDFSKTQGADVLSPEEFFEKMTTYPDQDQLDKKYDPPISQNDVEKWMEIFGVESGDEKLEQ